MVTWMIDIKGSVLVEEITFCSKAAVNVAIIKVDGCLAVVLNVRDFITVTITNGPMVD